MKIDQLFYGNLRRSPKELELYAAIRDYIFFKEIKDRGFKEASATIDSNIGYLDFNRLSVITSNYSNAADKLSLLLRKSLMKREVSKYNYDELRTMLNQQNNLIFRDQEDLDDIFIEYYVASFNNEYRIYEHVSFTFFSEVHEYTIKEPENE